MVLGGGRFLMSEAPLYSESVFYGEAAAATELLLIPLVRVVPRRLLPVTRFCLSIVGRG